MRGARKESPSGPLSIVALTVSVTESGGRETWAYSRYPVWLREIEESLKVYVSSCCELAILEDHAYSVGVLEQDALHRPVVRPFLLVAVWEAYADR
jgi:hypothetical protein